jgi:hypothetical protein
MTLNPIIRGFADTRWMYIKLKEIPPDTQSWSPPEPILYSHPFGSFVQDKDGNYIHSAIFTDIYGTTFTYNNSNIIDLFKTIDSCGQPIATDNKLYYPITLINNGTSVGTSTTSEPTNTYEDDQGNVITGEAGEPIWLS